MCASVCRSGIKLTREICQQPALAGVTKSELHPGADKQSDSDIDAYIRDTVHSGAHPCIHPLHGPAQARHWHASAHDASAPSQLRVYMRSAICDG